MTKLILFPRAKLLLVIILLFFISSGYAQEKEKRIIHPVMGTLSLSLESGITIPFTDYKNSQVGFAYRGSVGYYFNTYTNHFVGIKAFGGLGQIKGSDPNRTSPEFKTDIAFVGAGINYGYRISEKVFPSVFAGLSYLHFKPKDKNNQPLPNNLANVYSKDDVNLNFDLGLQYLITDQVTIGLSGGVAINFNDWLDDTERGNENDIFYNVMAGINYYVFGKKDSDKDGVDDDKDACPDTPEGVDVDENGCPIDTDRDGVPDYLDACSHTPAGVQVDSEGCPIDSDGDGIPDYLDRCPNTPQGVRVNNFGCPLDRDRDGVPDYLDKCPQTPKGIPVNRFGCPLDSDGDTVPDYLDKCPNTPKGIQVNKSGCPVDSDNDGVPDYLDKCPNTPAGMRVTPDGCSDEFYEYIFDASTLFKPGEAILSSNAYKELNEIVNKIKLRPDTKWRIEGHTDNRGGKDYNKTLSLLRAESVFNYFVSRGLSKDRFEVVGMGEDFPIADNNTPEGRKANRRVVLIRIE